MRRPHNRDRRLTDPCDMRASNDSMADRRKNANSVRDCLDALDRSCTNRQRPAGHPGRATLLTLNRAKR